VSGQRRAPPPDAVIAGLALAALISFCGIKAQYAIRDLGREQPKPVEYPAQNLRFSPDPRCCFEEPPHGWVDPRGVWVAEPAYETCLVDGGWVRR